MVGTGGEVLIAIASSRGAICLGRLLVPRLPGGTSPEDIQILDLAAEDQRLLPWAIPHKGAAVSVDIHAETKVHGWSTKDGRTVP